MADLDKFINNEPDKPDVETHTYVVLIPKHTGYMQVVYDTQIHILQKY